MSSLRVLHAIFSSGLAGSERYCVDLANRQVALGMDVHVAGSPASPLQTALDPRVTFHGIGRRWFRGYRLRRLIARLAVDVCHGHLSAACKALGRAADLTATVATLHVGYKAHQHGKLDAVICVNHAQASRLREYRGLSRIIPNWLPQDLSDDGGPTLREELKLSKDTFVIGSVGRLHFSKGMDVLINAFRTAAPANAALVIVGAGAERSELRRLRGGDERIYLVGFRPDVRECLRSFDLFVSPSREESFGLAILEAMSRKLPLIATATEGPTEFLKGLPVALVEPGSVDGMTRALGDAVVQFTAGRLGPVEYDLSGFDPAERVANVSELYGHVLKTKRRLELTSPTGAVVVS